MRLTLKRYLLLAVVVRVAVIALGRPVQPVLAQDQFSGSTAYTLDLRSYGWEPPEGRQRELSRPSIVVDHEGRVVLGFAVAARPGLVSRNRPSLDFHIMRFSPDGKMDSSLSLPTHGKGIDSIYLSDTDQVIARANDTLQFLQADSGELERGVWTTLCAESCRVAQSPTRRTLVLRTKSADRPLTIVRFSPQLALQRCGKADQSIRSDDDRIQSYIQYVTDEFVYFHNWEPESGYFTYRWPFCDYEHRVEVPPRVGSRWAVLNDSMFVVYLNSKKAKDDELEVISSDGRVKFRATMRKHESLGTTSPPIRSSAEGKQIAVDLITVKGANGPLDLSGHVTARRIAIYDINTGKELASVPVSSKLAYHFEFDLAPNGHRIAILEDNKVRVIDLGR